MSRIFDALQRSGVEQTGVEYADMVSVATKVFEAPTEEETPASPAGEFPTVEVSVVPPGRLCFSPSLRAWPRKSFASSASACANFSRTARSRKSW